MKIIGVSFIKLFIFLSLLLVSCAPKEKLVIVSTNDMHSAIDKMPALATLVDSLRGANADRFLLVDAGDRWTGNPYVDYTDEPGKPIIELMNTVGYDIATFGNHEWDNGTDLLAERTKFATFKKVLANADLSKTSMPIVPPYSFIDIGGLRVGFLGLLTNADNGHPAGKPESFEGIDFFDPWETAAEYKAVADSCDLYIAITHIGLPEDSLLAVQRPEIDLIIGGHSHDVVPVGRKINNTIVTQTGKGLRYAGVTTITYRGKKILSIENSLVELASIAPEQKTQKMVDSYNSNPIFKEKVGVAVETLNKLALMNLYSDLMRIESNAQIAFYNLGGMRIHTQPAGDILLEDVYSAEPFGNGPVEFLMSMEEMKDLILNKFNSTGKESHTMDLYPSGLSYQIITDADGKATDIFFKTDQKPFKDGKFKVVLSDYVSSAYIFSQQGGGKPVGKRITELAEVYIKKHSPIKPDDHNRVKIE